MKLEEWNFFKNGGLRQSSALELDILNLEEALATQRSTVK
jgi:hypothetical protein